MKMIAVLLAALYSTTALSGQDSAPNRTDDYTPPTDAQIAAVAEKPETLVEIIRGANDDQTVETVLKVIAAIETLDIGPEVKRNRVAMLFSKTIETQGEVMGNRVIARVVKRVNPRLLPIIRFGGTLGPVPPPPPPAPRYRRQ